MSGKGSSAGRKIGKGKAKDATETPPPDAMADEGQNIEAGTKKRRGMGGDAVIDSNDEVNAGDSPTPDPAPAPAPAPVPALAPLAPVPLPPALTPAPTPGFPDSASPTSNLQFSFDGDAQLGNGELNDSFVDDFESQLDEILNQPKPAPAPAPAPAAGDGIYIDARGPAAAIARDITQSNLGIMGSIGQMRASTQTLLSQGRRIKPEPVEAISSDLKQLIKDAQERVTAQSKRMDDLREEEARLAAEAEALRKQLEEDPSASHAMSQQVAALKVIAGLKDAIARRDEEERKEENDTNVEIVRLQTKLNTIMSREPDNTEAIKNLEERVAAEQSKIKTEQINTLSSLMDMVKQSRSSLLVVLKQFLELLNDPKASYFNLLELSMRNDPKGYRDPVFEKDGDADEDEKGDEEGDELGTYIFPYIVADHYVNSPIDIAPMEAYLEKLKAWRKAAEGTTADFLGLNSEDQNDVATAMESIIAIVRSIPTQVGDIQEKIMEERGMVASQLNKIFESDDFGFPISYASTIQMRQTVRQPRLPFYEAVLDMLVISGADIDKNVEGDALRQLLHQLELYRIPENAAAEIPEDDFFGAFDIEIPTAADDDADAGAGASTDADTTV